MVSDLFAQFIKEKKYIAKLSERTIHSYQNRLCLYSSAAVAIREINYQQALTSLLQLDQHPPCRRDGK
jgi:hypothetical protein